MAAFINNDITAAGLIVLAKGVAGEKINYTKIVLGDGYLEEGQTPRSLTDVVSPKAVIDITKCTVNGDGTVSVGGIFTNDMTAEGFYYRELGLYAEDPDPMWARCCTATATAATSPSGSPRPEAPPSSRKPSTS